jgi:hypothetical protein
MHVSSICNIINGKELHNDETRYMYIYTTTLFQLIK